MTSTKIVDLFFRRMYVRVRMLTPEQCRASRAWLGWTQVQLAERAQIGLSTIKDFENGSRDPIPNNLQAILRALEDGGMQMLFDARDRAAGIAVASYRPKK